MSLEFDILNKKVTRLYNKICCKQIKYSSVPLTGQAPCCSVFGINSTTGVSYYKDSSGNWQPIPSSSGGGGTPTYLKYVATLNQPANGGGSASAFTQQVLENTIGNIVWTQIDIGQYRGTLTNAFPTIEKVWVIIASNKLPNISISAHIENANSVIVEVLDSVPDYRNNFLNNTALEIRVYP